MGATQQGWRGALGAQCSAVSILKINMYSILLLTFVVFVLMCILNLLQVPLSCFSYSLFFYTVVFGRHV